MFGHHSGDAATLGRASSPTTGQHRQPARRRLALAGTFEAGFLGYIACNAAAGRAFAHLHLTAHGVPVFPGELVLAVLTVLALAIHGPRGLFPRRFDFAAVSLLLVLAYGTVLAIRGLAEGYGLAALRDFALVYYAWFYFLTLAYLRQGGTPKRVLGALLLGSVAGASVAMVHFVASPTLIWGHGVVGHTALYAWIAIVILLAILDRANRVAMSLAAGVVLLICSFVVFLSGYRTMLAVVAVSAVLTTAISAKRARAFRPRLARWIWIWTATFVLTIVAARLAIPQTSRAVPANGPLPLSDALASVTYRWASDRYGPDPFRLRSPAGPPTIAGFADETGSLEFRLDAWREAGRRILRSPWFGIGFGPSAILFPQSDCDTLPSPTSNCGAAHNTYLTLAMRMGVPATLLVCSVLCWALVASVVGGHAATRDGNRLSMALVLLSMLVFGATSLIFESPYLSSIVWMAAGTIMGANQKDRSVSPAQ